MVKLDEEKINHLSASLRELEYGSIVITVHDGEITQIDTTEKRRFFKTKRNKQSIKQK
ncbi:MAG TPA: YezD family protein [Bacillota bacterium]